MNLRCCILDDYQSVALSMGDWQKLYPTVTTVAMSRHLEGLALHDALQDCDIVVAMRERTPFDAALFAQLPRLRLLVTSGMRNSAIDLAAARARGITVCGTSSRSEPPAELTWALILALNRHLILENGMLRSSGPWQSTVGGDLAGRTLGIIGLGKIGSRVARIATAFDMKVIAWSPNLTDERAAESGALSVNKQELFERSDICTVHLVLSAETRHVVGARDIARLGPHALFVNAARAGLVDTHALAAALAAGRIAGAGIDVFDMEPLSHDHVFRILTNVLATPHLGYVTRSNYEVYFREAVEDIWAFLQGAPIRVLT